MKQLFTLLFSAAIAIGCSNVKNIYSSNDVNEHQLEKLGKSYAKNPGDSAAANRVLYVYNILHTDQLNRIDRLQHNNSLQNLEQLVREYDALQSFYNNAGQNAAMNALVKPGNVWGERQVAVEKAAAAWYEEANRLLATDNWKSGRKALSVLQKVNLWIPNYQDSRRMQREATEMGTIDAVIDPLRNEGFFYNSGYNNTNSRFTRQLVADLGSRWANPELYRVYDSREANSNNLAADWLIEPVITGLQLDPVNYNRSTRTVTRKIEVGKDSTKSPVYKTITAVLTITDASLRANTEMEARISDLRNNTRIGRRSFTENYTLRERSATFTGDKDALSADDWKLVNNHDRINVDERWLQEKLLEQLYLMC